MTRIESVDIFRLIAIVAVITIHTSPFRGDVVENETYKYLDVIFNQISRFAVPFFFIISGYFWGAKIRSGSDPMSSSIYMAKRILIIFLAWCFIYLLPLNLSSIYEYGALGPIKVAYWNISNLAQDPVTLLLQGTKVHLWFLIGMLCALMVSTFFVITKKTKLLIVLSISLYLFGVLAKSYANTPIGINIDLNTRNGPFFSTLLFVTGYILSLKNINTKWALYGFLVFCIGSIVHFLEIYTLESI
jgi:surface polysaccharide O-acyltransferase-like enzyme